MSLTYLKFSDLLPKTHLFIFLPYHGSAQSKVNKKNAIDRGDELFGIVNWKIYLILNKVMAFDVIKICFWVEG